MEVDIRFKLYRETVTLFGKWGYSEIRKGKRYYPILRISTGRKFQKEKWDDHYSRPTSEWSFGDKFKFHKELDERENQVRQAVERLGREFGAVSLVHPSLVKNEINALSGTHQTAKRMPKTIPDSIELYIGRHELTSATIKHYRFLINRLNSWNKKGLNWVDFDNEQYDDFLDFLVGLQLTSNTLWTYQKRMNAIINYSKKKGQILRVQSSNRFKFRTGVSAVLSWVYVARLTTHIPSSEPRSNIQKIMLCLLHTGCRISDIWSLFDPRNHLLDDEMQIYWAYKSKKTKIYSVVPVFDEIQHIVLDDMPYKVSDQKINVGIKNLMFEIFEEEEVIVKGERFVICDHIRNHSLRKSFITECLRRGIPPHLIQQAVGHKENYGNEVFRAYDQLGNLEKAMLLRDFWEQTL